MKFWTHYYIAQSVEDAIQALADAPGPARLIAGGTDLLLDLQQGRHPVVDTLVDVTQVAEMTRMEIRGEELFVGAAVPLNKLVRSSLIAEHARALVEACGLIGGPQVRNTATLGGNVAHALPAADGAIALLALRAEAVIASCAGRRRAPLDSLYLGPGRSALKAQEELLVGFYLPLLRPGQSSAFRRVMRPQGVALPILNMAIWLERRNDRIEGANLAVGPSGPTLRLMPAVSAALCGGSLDESTLRAAAEALLQSATFRTSPFRATAEYRRHLAVSLLEDTLQAAWERASMQDLETVR